MKRRSFLQSLGALVLLPFASFLPEKKPRNLLWHKTVKMHPKQAIEIRLPEVTKLHMPQGWLFVTNDSEEELEISYGKDHKISPNSSLLLDKHGNPQPKVTWRFNQ